MAAGAHGRRGPHPALTSRRANFSSPGPLRPPARRPLALPPPAQRPTTSRARPLPPPAPAPAVRNRPRRSPLAARGPHSVRLAPSGPAPRAVNPFAAGDARGRGRGRGGAGGRCARLGSPCPALAPRRVLPAGSWQRSARTHGPTRTGSGSGFPTPRRPLLPPREGKGRGGRGLAAGWAAQLGASGGAGCGLEGLRAAQVRCWPASSLATAACTDNNEWTVNQVFTES